MPGLPQMGTTLKQPAVFIAHGGGPMPLLGHPSQASLTRWLQGFAETLREAPKAILIVSAHWEAQTPTLTSGAQPQLIYDYYGFPPESYSIKYDAPGLPSLAEQTAALLRAAGFAASLDPKRGFDHGVFVPLKLAFPAAAIPVVQLSLLSSLDAVEHIRIGQAISPLREGGVLIVGSGMSYHNMRGFSGGQASSAADASREFDTFLTDALTSPMHSPEQRLRLLADWAGAPSARACHPREEHLLPLHVVAGAASGAAGRVIYRDELMGVRVSSYQFDD